MTGYRLVTTAAVAMKNEPDPDRQHDAHESSEDPAGDDASGSQLGAAFAGAFDLPTRPHAELLDPIRGSTNIAKTSDRIAYTLIGAAGGGHGG
jgi:hypothetical protein